MKKTLTPNISRYDSKMLLRLNKRTVKALLVSVLIGILSWLVLMWLPTVYAVSAAVAIALISMLVQLVEVDGVTILRVISLQIWSVSAHTRRQYEHSTTNPTDRLIIDERSDFSEKEK